MDEKQQPLVSCIMPTYNRRKFIRFAIQYFLRQSYEFKELIIVDDGTDNIEDLIPDSHSIRYIRLDEKISLGAKLNLACKYAKGTVIANWDDDDWYSAGRLKYQVDALQQMNIELCGINNLLYYDTRNNSAYKYIYPPDQRTWLLGSSLCYKKEFWNRNNFADINVGVDGLFVWASASGSARALPDSSISVHMIHNENVSPKKTNGSWWHAYPLEEIQKIMGADLLYYQGSSFTADHNLVQQPKIGKASINKKSRQFKNVFACLVHENEDCIIDLVRNLHYQDPSSIILLYNGGDGANIISGHFPFEEFGVVLHPKPLPVKHGYLHTFALSCMEFSLQNLCFDTFTVVDSDQLAIRAGYTEYLGAFFSSRSGIGMLSNKPTHLSLDNTAPDDYEVWPAIQALKEYDLWKPLLSKFNQGENKFVHWTFWPSCVFTMEAVRDLTKLFKKNKLLQDIMKQTKIWATEEVILPTMVSLLGYEICLNPCNYDFVKYQKSFTAHDINAALAKTDAYWIHPIERRYDDPLRKHLRIQFNHYIPKKQKLYSSDDLPADLVLRTSLIKKIENIEGWLNDKEAELLIEITFQVCKNLSLTNSIVEIGSYHGKSTVLFGSILQAFFPNVKLYAIDIHDGRLGAVDQGLQFLPPSWEMFKQNIENAGLSGMIDIIKDNSWNVEWNNPISLLFIDGLHDYPNVARDFYHFSEWIRPGGYVAFHDYADYFPGVQAFVHELLDTEAYGKVYKVDSLIVLKKL